MKRFVKQWAVVALVVPAVGWALGKVAGEVAQRRGEDSKLARGLSLSGRALRSR